MVGDPLDAETDVGPLITPGDRDRVKEWIDEAVAAGAELLTGGELVDEGRCLAPTLLGAPPREAKVWCEEIFGPVATIDRFSDFGEALRAGQRLQVRPPGRRLHPRHRPRPRGRPRRSSSAAS